MSVYKELQNWVNKGYLLHGSRHEFDLIKPNKKDRLHKKVGRLKAVYATDEPLIAMFKAVIHSPKLRTKEGLVAWGFNAEGNIKFRVTPNYFVDNAFAEGYVYICLGKKFVKSKKMSREYYRQKPIRPHAVKIVNPDDFLCVAVVEKWPLKEALKQKIYTRGELLQMGY
jgi:hypothetical protein